MVILSIALTSYITIDKEYKQLIEPSMKLHFLFFLLFINFLSIKTMETLNSVTENISCEAMPLWRPNSNELIIQKSIPHKPKVDPNNPDKFLPAIGLLSQLCVYNILTKTEKPLEDSYKPYFLSRCSAKGTYLAAMAAQLSILDESTNQIKNVSNSVSIWNLSTQAKIAHFFTHDPSFVISPEEKYIGSSGHETRNLVIHSMVTGDIIHTFTRRDQHSLAPTPFHSHEIVFSPDDQWVAIEDHGIIHIQNMDNPTPFPISIEGYMPQFGTHNKLIMRQGTTLLFCDTSNFKSGTFNIVPYKDLPNFRRDSKFLISKDCLKVLIPIAPHTLNGRYQRFDCSKLELLPGTYNIIATSDDFSLFATKTFEETFISSFEENTLEDRKDGKHYCIKFLLDHAFFSADNQYLFLENTRTIIIWCLKKGIHCFIKTSIPGFPLYKSSCSPDSTHLLVRSSTDQAILIDLRALTYKPID